MWIKNNFEITVTNYGFKENCKTTITVLKIFVKLLKPQSPTDDFLQVTTKYM